LPSDIFQNSSESQSVGILTDGFVDVALGGPVTWRVGEGGFEVCEVCFFPGLHNDSGWVKDFGPRFKVIACVLKREGCRGVDWSGTHSVLDVGAPEQVKPAIGLEGSDDAELLVTLGQVRVFTDFALPHVIRGANWRVLSGNCIRLRSITIVPVISVLLDTCRSFRVSEPFRMRSPTVSVSNGP
jgi:hypothetical protein